MNVRNFKYLLLHALAGLVLLTPYGAAGQNRSVGGELIGQARDAFRHVYDRYGEEERKTNYGGSYTLRNYQMISFNTNTRLCRAANGRLAVFIDGTMEQYRLKETFNRDGSRWPRPGDGSVDYEPRLEFIIPVDITASNDTYRFEFATQDIELNWYGDRLAWVDEVYADNFPSAVRNKRGEVLSMNSSDRESYARSPEAFTRELANALKPCGER